ncbi:type II secretion system F family protein [Candidatus Micrarchaeota archaeon]|nr:type II secretion system F family protein [Candidatus Micrarchaeota archaeon]
MKIPFSLLPPPLVEKFSKMVVFSRLGNIGSTFFPALHQQLLQIESTINPREYTAMAIVASFFNSVFILILGLILSTVAGKQVLIPAFIGTFLIGLISFLTIQTYPKIIANKRAKKLENELVPAMRQLLIQVKSGVPLFEGMTGVCDGYGEVSLEFRKMVRKINAGIPMQEVLEEKSKGTASLQFRRVLWQIGNALKVGTDVGKALEEIISDLVLEKIDDIRRYGQELSPWTMIYMLAAIVTPSLGITMMLVIISFLGVEVPKIVFAAVLVFITGFQLFFTDFVRSRRPAIEDI